MMISPLLPSIAQHRAVQSSTASAGPPATTTRRIHTPEHSKPHTHTHARVHTPASRQLHEKRPAHTPIVHRCGEIPEQSMNHAAATQPPTHTLYDYDETTIWMTMWWLAPLCPMVVSCWWRRQVTHERSRVGHLPVESCLGEVKAGVLRSPARGRQPYGMARGGGGERGLMGVGWVCMCGGGAAHQGAQCRCGRPGHLVMQLCSPQLTPARHTQLTLRRKCGHRRQASKPKRTCTHCRQAEPVLSCTYLLLEALQQQPLLVCLLSHEVHLVAAY